MIKKVSFFVFLPFLSLLLPLGIAPAVQAQETNPESTISDTPPAHVAIKIENETVPMKVFNRRVENLLKNYRKEADRKGQKYDPKKVRDRLQRKVKNQIISRTVSRIHMQRSDVTVSDERVQKAIDRTIQKAGSKKEYKKQLEEDGSSLDEARKAIRQQMLVKKYIRQNMPKVTVTDTEIQEVYLNNKEQFQGISGNRAYRFIKKRLRRRKENRASKAFIGKLRDKTDIWIHPSLRE